MVIIMLIFFVGGFFMDTMALIVILIPILFPIVTKLGYDTIWFGVITILLGEMGVITPPVGVNVFVIKGIAPEVPLEVIFRGIMPFLIALIAAAVIITIFPQIATFLPSFMY
jgi:TRAP-type C4-dicarboxylate transport system permease large subunit